MAWSDVRENPIGIAKKYLGTFAMDIVVIAVSLGYVLYQMITLEPTQLNPWILVAEGIISVFCGVVIKQALGENGFSRGYNSEAWIEEEKLYDAACNEAVEFADRIENYTNVLEIEKTEHYRRVHLQAKRMKYSMWFDENGNYIGLQEKVNGLRWDQKRALKKAIKVRVYVPNLFSHSATASEKDTKSEETDNGQRLKAATKNTITAVIISAIGVYFMPQLTGWNWATVIASFTQVALWITFGIIQLYTNYNFVVTIKKNGLRDRIILFRRFIKDCKNGKYVDSPYQNFDSNYPVTVYN